MSSGSIQGDPAGQNLQPSRLLQAPVILVRVLEVSGNDGAIDLDRADGPGELVVARAERHGLCRRSRPEPGRPHGRAERVGGHVNGKQANTHDRSLGAATLRRLSDNELHSLEERSPE